MAITIALGLKGDDAARAIDLAPDFAAVEGGYGALAAEAGWVDVAIEDVTAAYLDTLVAWTQAWALNAEAVTAVVGEDEFIDRQTRRGRGAVAIRDGLIVRQLLTATRSG